MLPPGKTPAPNTMPPKCQQVEIPPVRATDGAGTAMRMHTCLQLFRVRDCVAAARCARAGKAGCALSCARRHPASASAHVTGSGPTPRLHSGRLTLPRPRLAPPPSCYRSRVRRRLRSCPTHASVRLRLRAALPRGGAPRSASQSCTQNARGRGAPFGPVSGSPGLAASALRALAAPGPDPPSSPYASTARFGRFRRCRIRVDSHQR